MAMMNITVDMPQYPRFDVDKFKNRVQDFASMLIVLMSKGEENVCGTRQELSQSEALDFIQSLSVKGGEVIPNDVNPMECFIQENYER